ncbi:hypothetical protein LEMLEM_LOCUS22832, partial [Lemmus lemmus]
MITHRLMVYFEESAEGGGRGSEESGMELWSCLRGLLPCPAFCFCQKHHDQKQTWEDPAYRLFGTGRKSDGIPVLGGERG